MVRHRTKYPVATALGVVIALATLAAACGRVSYSRSPFDAATGPLVDAGGASLDAGGGARDAGASLIDAAAFDAGSSSADAGSDAARVDAGRADAGRADAGADAGSDAGSDAGTRTDAGGVVPPASGHLFVLTGTSQRILSYSVNPDGTPHELGAQDCYHQGRAIVLRPDGNGVFIWTTDGAGSSEFQAYAVSGGVATGSGFTLDIGGASLLAGAPIVVTPDNSFVYGGYIMGGSSSVQARAGVGSFSLLSPFSAPLAAPPGGMAVSTGSDVLFVSTPSTGQIHPHVIASGAGTLSAAGTAISGCAQPGVLAAHPTMPVIYAACTGSGQLAAFSYAAGTGALTALGTQQPVSASTTDLIVDSAGAWVLSLSETTGVIDMVQILGTGALMERAMSFVSASARGISFDASQSRVYVATATTLDEYYFDRTSPSLTMRSTTPLSATDAQAITSGR